MKVYKFGGASIKDAAGFRNVCSILQSSDPNGLAVVISALGKTTNALEDVVRAYCNDDANALDLFNAVRKNHFDILQDLIPDKSHDVFRDLNNLFVEVEWVLEENRKESYDYTYDQVVSIGEFASTTIAAAFFNYSGVKTKWLDAREFIKTDDKFREALVDWDKTNALVKQTCNKTDVIQLTQGFIGCTPENFTTTLGREGSDYTAAILAFALDAESVTIWKDVPGVLNADPRFFPQPKLIPALSYHEAIEMTYYGATVIHPKTLKPLQNKQIPLYVKSFVKPDENGTVIHTDMQQVELPATWVKKTNQTLVSISAKDFSFIAEEHLEEIFNILSCSRVHVNMMQNSALSFSVCVDDGNDKLESCLEQLRGKYKVRTNANLHLVTVRHYNDGEIGDYLREKNVLLDQRSRNTIQVIHE
ncbi:MAG TPA: aspartate kinase [Chitinophagales bacterium]|nr:aspartate kinase [Chitinophagales bacterium]